MRSKPATKWPSWRPRAARLAAGGSALIFAVACWAFLTLPDVRSLRRSNPVTTAFIELRLAEARDAGRTGRKLQRWVPYERISPTLRRAVLVAEDAAFFQHEGIDVEQLRISIEQGLEEGRPIRGASTITQQLAKNLFLSPSRDPLRKLRELLITRRLEAELSKRRILELYLNVIEWGDGIYGAEAAARAYFGKPASALSREEAALLAAAIINPRVHSPARPTARLRRRQRLILARMGQLAPPTPAVVSGTLTAEPAERDAATPGPAPRYEPEGIDQENPTEPVPQSLLVQPARELDRELLGGNTREGVIRYLDSRNVRNYNPLPA